MSTVITLVRKTLCITGFFLLLIPLTAYGAPPENFRDFVGILLEIIQAFIIAVFTLTVIVFLWGIIKAWIIHGGDPDEIAKGKKVVLVGIVVLVITSGLWGLLEILRYSFFGV